MSQKHPKTTPNLSKNRCKYVFWDALSDRLYGSSVEILFSPELEHGFWVILGYPDFQTNLCAKTK
jgi:hypothetical protein